MTQFVAFALSVYIALSIAQAMSGGVSPQARIYLHPPKAVAGTEGVSGGGPVGSATSNTAPTPPPQPGAGT